MSSNCPPQLQLSIQSNTSNFKRSFEEFGFDLESPVGSGTDGGGGSSVNDRNKRARSSSSFSESSDSADDSHRSSVLGSASDSSSTSNSSLLVVEEPPVISSAAQDGSTTSTAMRASSLDHPPRLPTPTIQDIDMTEVLPEALDTELVTPQETQQRHQQVQDRYRLSLERFNAFENEISILRRSQPSLNATRSPTPPPTLPPLSVVSSSSSSSSLHPQTHVWARTSPSDMPFLHSLPARTASPLTENIFADVGEGSSGTRTGNPEIEDTEQVSNEVPAGPHFGRMSSYPQFQNRSDREGNGGIEGEIEVVNVFRERLNSALERLRSASPLVPELEEVVRQDEDSTGQETIEGDGDEGPTGPTPSLSADPPTLPPIPPISADEWAHPVSFLHHNRGISSSAESFTRPTVTEQAPDDLDISQDTSTNPTYMQRFLHMRRHQQQRILEMQQYLRSSRPRTTDATSSNDNSRPFNLSDHSLPSPMLRDLRQWMDERPPIEETSALRGSSSGLSPRTDPPIPASQSTDGNINQEQRQPSQPSHGRPTLHSHTSVDSGTWRFVNSLFTDQATPSTFETELFNRTSSISPTGATSGSSEHNPPSTSTPNSNSDTPSNSGSVSYGRNLTDEAAVRSLDHGVGIGLGFPTRPGTRSTTSTTSTTTPRRYALLAQQTRNPEEPREIRTAEGPSSDRIERLRILLDPHEDFRPLAPADLDSTFSDPDLDFSSLAGAVGSTTSSPSPPSEWDFFGSNLSPVTPSSPGIHRLPDFLNPTMSSLDFLSPTAAATAPSNLPVNIRHLWGENPRQPPSVTRHDHLSLDVHSSSSRATTSALPRNDTSISNGVTNPTSSTNQLRLRREPQPRHDIRNLFRNEEHSSSRNSTDYADPSSASLNFSSSSRVPTTASTYLSRLNAMERHSNQIDYLQRPRLRPFHLQTRPGSSTSLVGENAAEMRRREERARLRALLGNSGTEQSGNSNGPAVYDSNTTRPQLDGSDQASTTRPTPSTEGPAAFEGPNSSSTGGMRSRPTIDTAVYNAWRSIHGLDIPDPTPMDDETSTVSGNAINRLSGTRETGSTAFNSSSISSSTMDTTDATRNNTNDEDVDMLGGNEEETDYEHSWSPFNLDSDGDFLSWLNFNTERSAPRSSMGAEAAIRGSTEGPSSFNRDLDLSFASAAARRPPFWDQMPRGTGAEGPSTATRRRRYSDIFEAEPRSDNQSAHPVRERSSYLLSDFVPSLPSPDLGGSFEPARPSHTAPSRSGESYSNSYDFSTASTSPLISGGSSRASTEDWPNTRPLFQRLGVDGDSRPRSSLWATLTREPTRGGIVQPSYDEFRAQRQEQREDLEARHPTLAQLRTHIQEQRARIEELRGRSPSILAQNDRRNINPSAYAPGPFRNTLQHRLDEQAFARYMQSRREQLPPSNPPTIPPLSFGDDNLTSLSGAIQTSPRTSNDVPSNSTQTAREPTLHDRVLPHLNPFDYSTQSRYTPRSYASARTANQLDVNRELLHSHHMHHFRPDDHPSRPSRDVPSQTSNISPSRNSELNPAQARHGLHPFFRHRPHSADARPAPNPAPSTQNTRLPQPPILRAGAGYGRYIALSPHLMHTHSPEDGTTPTGQAQTPANRRIFPAMAIDDETDRGGHPVFARGRRARPNSGHLHETMYMFGRFGHLRRGRAIGDFMRDEDFDESYESLLSLAQTLGDVKPKSTPAEIIEKLEKGQYKDWATAESDQRCPICLDDYEQTDTVLKLNNCSHWLHQDCLHQWLQTANTCPVCRKSVTGTNTGSRTRGQAHHHHHHRNNPFSGPSTSFRHHAHAHTHGHTHGHTHAPPSNPRRQRSSSNANPNTGNTNTADAPPPLPLPSSQHSHSHSHSNPNPNPAQGNGGNHDDNAPWRRAPRD